MISNFQIAMSTWLQFQFVTLMLTTQLPIWGWCRGVERVKFTQLHLLPCLSCWLAACCLMQSKNTNMLLLSSLQWQLVNFIPPHSWLGSCLLFSQHTAITLKSKISKVKTLQLCITVKKVSQWSQKNPATLFIITWMEKPGPCSVKKPT